MRGSIEAVSTQACLASTRRGDNQIHGLCVKNQTFQARQCGILNVHLAMLRIIVKEEADIAILQASGRITLGEGSVSFRDTVKEVLRKGFRKLILDLTDVTYVDSSGMPGEMVSAFTSTRNLGGELLLVNPQKKVSDLMQITKLYTVFKIFPDVNSAIVYFSTPPKATKAAR